MSEIPRVDHRLRDVATFVRSKNAGPFFITIDVFFEDEEAYQRAIQSNGLSPQSVADQYGLSPEQVRIFHVAQARAVKVSFPRPRPAGDEGDVDVAGGQQFRPLLDLPLR